MSDDSSSRAKAVMLKSAGGWRLAIVGLFATIALYFASQLFGGLLLGVYSTLFNHMSLGQTNSWLQQSVQAQFIFTILVYGLLLFGIWVILGIFRWSWATIGLTPLKARYIAVGIAAAVPYYILYAILLAVISHFVPSLNVKQHQDIGFNSVHGLLALSFTFLSLVVVPPLVEEITMRGFLYTSLRRWLPRIVAALAVSALFGLAHLPEGGTAGPLWVGAIDTFTLSLVLVYLREKTGNLWAGITLHAVKNGIAFVVLFLVIGR